MKTFKCISCGMQRQDSQSSDDNISICIFCAEPENNIEETPEPDVCPVCANCDSDDITHDGMGSWDDAKQEWEWELADHDPAGWCRKCEDTCRIIWKEC